MGFLGRELRQLLELIVHITNITAMMLPPLKGEIVGSMQTKACQQQWSKVIVPAAAAAAAAAETTTITISDDSSGN